MSYLECSKGLQASFVKVLFALSSFLVIPALWAETWVCSSDTESIQAQHGMGRVATKIESSSTCTLGKRLRFELPKKGYMCSPSSADNLPDGWVVTGGKNSGTSSSRQIEGGRICDNAFDWAFIEEPRSSGITQICDDSPIPSGYVVTDNKLRATGDCRIRMEIQKPRASTSITTKCQTPAHPVPPGYVIREIRLNSNCKFNTQTHFREGISLPNTSGETSVCQGTAVPPGFAFSSTTSTANCGDAGGFTIGPVSSGRGQLCASTDSDVPDGYVISEISPTGSCSGFYKSTVVVAPSSSGATAACQLTLGSYIVPEGFVISSKTTGARCDGAAGYAVEVPDPSGQLVCAESPIPEGWAVTEELDHPNCADFGSGSAMVIKPFGDGGSTIYYICQHATVPEGFVKTKKFETSSCSSGIGWQIVEPNESPGHATVVCNTPFEQVPPGFVVTERSEYVACEAPFGAAQGFLISKPALSGQTLSCNASVFGDDALVPSGFVVNERGFYSNCAVGLGDTAPGVMIELPSGNGPITACPGSEIPPGYIITEDSGTQCTMIIEVPSAQGESFACRRGPIPEGYVIRSIVTSSKCDFDEGMTISLPNPNGRTLVCAGSPIPPGFVRATYGADDYVQCDGPGFLVIPDGSGQAGGTAGIAPNIFIDAEPNVQSKPAGPSVLCQADSLDGGVLRTAFKNSAGCN